MSFWIPFVTTCAIQCSIVPIRLVEALPDQRWSVFVATFAKPCCEHTGDLIRACSVACDVWKIVSTKTFDLKRGTSLYNPFVMDMRESFQLRATTLRHLMSAPTADVKWTRVLELVNKRVLGRRTSCTWHRCAGKCTFPIFLFSPFPAMPLFEWSKFMNNSQGNDD